MNKHLSLLIIWIMIIPVGIVCAQENPKPIDDFEARLSSMKNPFKPQLPEAEEEEVIYEKPNIRKKILKPVEDQPDKAEIAQEEIEPLKAVASGEIKSTDPFPPTTEIEEIVPLPDIKVSGVIWNSDRPQAIINERIVDIGDTVSGIEITEIRKTDIEGLFHGRTVTIKTQRSQL